MKLFFIKIRAWQLALLLALIYLVPLTIGFNWIYTVDRAGGTDFGARSIIYFFRAIGVMAIVISIVLFLWKWSLGHYLYELLPDKEEVNFKMFRLSLLINLAVGIIWGLLFLTGLVVVLLFATGDTPYLFFLLIFLYVLIRFLFIRANIFPYLAAKAVLQNLPYRAITLSLTFIGFVRMIELQTDVNEIYSKFGMSGKADQETIL